MEMHTVIDKLTRIYNYALYWCARLCSLGVRTYTVSIMVFVGYLQIYYEEFIDAVLNAISNKINDDTPTDSEISWTDSRSETRSRNSVGQNSKLIGQLLV